jgi:hypothetical protein
MSEKKRPGRKPEKFKVDVPFEDAVKAALRTPPPDKEEKKPSKG